MGLEWAVAAHLSPLVDDAEDVVGPRVNGTPERPARLGYCRIPVMLWDLIGVFFRAV